jgi:predicted amidohydrolase YtcJ
VVTQPSFLVHRGTKYREQLSEVEQSWLYRVGSLVGRGVAVAFSSDLPVVPARPQEWIAAAVDRAGFNPDEAVDRATAESLARGLGAAGAYRAR